MKVGRKFRVGFRNFRNRLALALRRKPRKRHTWYVRHVRHARPLRHVEKGHRHPFLLIISGILLLAGIALTVYSLIGRDFNSVLLGLGIMFFSLVVGLMIVRLGRKRGVKIRREKEEKKALRTGFKTILYIIFLLLGISASVYFIFFRKDYSLMAISVIIVLLSGIGIIRLRKSRFKAKFSAKVQHEKGKEKVKGEKEKEEKAEKREKEKPIGKSEIPKFRRIVKGKIKNLGQDKTPLDVLYWLLETEKQIKFPDIAKIFNIDLKKVEIWAKILENNDLAEVHYPAFGNPSLKLKVKTDKEEEVTS